MRDLYCSSVIHGGRPKRGGRPSRGLPGPLGPEARELVPPDRSLGRAASGREAGGGGGGRLVNSLRGTTMVRLVPWRSWVTLVPKSTRFISVTLCSPQYSPFWTTPFACNSM